jgi:hypothetical protein
MPTKTRNREVLPKIERIELSRDEVAPDAKAKPDLGKTLPHFSGCGLPLRVRKDTPLKYSRRDGDMTLTIKGDPEYGMPRAGTDTATLVWFFTEALNHNSPIVEFDNAADILNDWRVDTGGYTYESLVASIKRLFGAKFEFEWQRVVPEFNAKEVETSQCFLFRRVRLWYQYTGKKGSQKKVHDVQLPLRGPGFKNLAELDPVVWNWLVGQRAKWFRVMPVYALRQNRGAQQLYIFAMTRAMRLWEEQGHKYEGSGKFPFVDIPLTGKMGLDEQLGAAKRADHNKWKNEVQDWIKALKLAAPELKDKLELVSMSDPRSTSPNPKKWWYLRIHGVPEPKAPRRLTADVEKG